MANIIDESIINLDPDNINFDDKDEVKAIFVALLNTIQKLYDCVSQLRIRMEDKKWIVVGTQLS